MIQRIKKFYNTKIDGRTPKNRKKDLKLKFLQVCLIGYGLIFILSILSIELFPISARVILVFYAIDLIRARFFNKGIFKAFYNKLEMQEFHLWKFEMISSVTS